MRLVVKGANFSVVHTTQLCQLILNQLHLPVKKYNLEIYNLYSISRLESCTVSSCIACQIMELELEMIITAGWQLTSNLTAAILTHSYNPEKHTSTRYFQYNQLCLLHVNIRVACKAQASKSFLYKRKYLELRSVTLCSQLSVQ